jgi:hypothetical protein
VVCSLQVNAKDRGLHNFGSTLIHGHQLCSSLVSKHLQLLSGNQMRAQAGSSRLSLPSTKAPAVQFASVFTLPVLQSLPPRCRRLPSPVLTHSTQTDSAQPSSISQLIADVLNQEAVTDRHDGVSVRDSKHVQSSCGI